MENCVEKVFEEWKSWIKKHNRTPKFHSEDLQERALAQKIKYYISKARKAPEKYSTILKEYQETQLKFNYKYIIKKSKEETFDIWRKWCIEHKRLPSYVNGNEKLLSQKIALCIREMKKNNKKYSKQLTEYYRLLSLYGTKKTIEERVTEWKAWVIKHERLPKRSSSDDYEARMANNIYRIYCKMLDKPEVYGNLVTEYENICNLYKASKIDVFDIFENWKKWVYQYGELPSSCSLDKSEAKLSNSMNYVLSLMKSQSETYSKELMEHSQICDIYAGKKKINKYKLQFNEYKNWIQANKQFPGYTSKDVEERHLADKMGTLFRIMKRQPEEFAEELIELDKLYKDFGRSEKQTIIKALEELKMWTDKMGKFPKSSSKSDYEAKLYKRISRCVKLMREKPTIYSTQLREYENIIALYGKDIENKKLFANWKEWVVKNEKLPSCISNDEYEKSLALKIKYFITKLSDSSKENKIILQEYDFICQEYSRELVMLRRNRKIFAEWKKWCILNRKTPNSSSNDKDEVDLYNKMVKCLTYMRGKSREYAEMLCQYEHVTRIYKCLKKYEKQTAILDVEDK